LSLSKSIVREQNNNKGEQLDYKTGLKAADNNSDSHRHLYKEIVIEAEYSNGAMLE
jgi:hypothetical protein